jgi:phage tail-like protein
MPNGFVKNVHRKDPYKTFNFRLILDGNPVAFLSKMGKLTRTTDVIPFRSGNDPTHDTKSPGRTTYQAITLERGLTHDQAFKDWANKIHQFGGNPLTDLVGYKKDVILEMLNEKHQVAHRLFLYNAWVSEFTAMPDLDANANTVAIESIKIEIEGFEEDPNTVEPDESA